MGQDIYNIKPGDPVKVTSSSSAPIRKLYLVTRQVTPKSQPQYNYVTATSLNEAYNVIGSAPYVQDVRYICPKD